MACSAAASASKSQPSRTSHQVLSHELSGLGIGRGELYAMAKGKAANDSGTPVMLSIFLRASQQQRTAGGKLGKPKAIIYGLVWADGAHGPETGACCIHVAAHTCVCLDHSRPRPSCTTF